MLSKLISYNHSYAYLQVYTYYLLLCKGVLVVNLYLLCAKMYIRIYEELILCALRHA